MSKWEIFKKKRKNEQPPVVAAPAQSENPTQDKPLEDNWLAGADRLYSELVLSQLTQEQQKAERIRLYEQQQQLQAEGFKRMMVEVYIPQLAKIFDELRANGYGVSGPEIGYVAKFVTAGAVVKTIHAEKDYMAAFSALWTIIGVAEIQLTPMRYSYPYYPNPGETIFNLDIIPDQGLFPWIDVQLEPQTRALLEAPAVASSKGRMCFSTTTDKLPLAAFAEKLNVLLVRRKIINADKLTRTTPRGI